MYLTIVLCRVKVAFIAAFFYKYMFLVFIMAMYVVLLMNCILFATRILDGACELHWFDILCQLTLKIRFIVNG